jgi:hypothetical protein
MYALLRLKKLAKENNHQTGKNAANPVTLFRSHL